MCLPEEVFVEFVESLFGSETSYVLESGDDWKNNRQETIFYEIQVHEQSGDSAVAIDKWMDFHKIIVNFGDFFEYISVLGISKT